MANQVKLHVGYIGKTLSGHRFEFVDHDEGDDTFLSCVGTWHHADGRAMCYGSESKYDIIGPWAEGKTEYEPDVWYGWNGGECPVHPKTRGDLTYADGTVYVDVPFGVYDWDEPLMFRIVTPYVEPRKPREFTLYVDELGNAATWSGGDMMPVASKCEVIKVRQLTK